MIGKVCLVTGATSGIGQITAAALAAQGAEVIVHGRNRQKAEETARRIRAETGNDAVHVLLADFADLDQVRALAVALQARFGRLDVLINNAGAYFNTRQRTPVGVEKTFLVNHLAPFLLTNLLLEQLQKSAPARIINLSSDAHRYGTLDLDDLTFRRFYFGFWAYARSKLANILFTYELARRLGDGEVTANAVHPGHVATDIWRTNFSLIGPIVKWTMGLFAVTPEQGADNSIYLATAPEVAGVTGEYFVKREPVASSPLSRNEALARRLWEVSETLASL